MKGSEFLRKVKRYRWVPSRGACSHGTVYVGERSAVVKDLKKELGPGLFRSMCGDLDIDPRDL